MRYFIGFSLLLLFACQDQPLGSSASADAIYNKAFKQSLRPKEKMVYAGLQPIRQDNEQLRWDEEGRVLMTGLSTWNAYNDQAGKHLVMGNDFWVVPANSFRQYVETQRKAERFSKDRLLQKMGKLPSTQTYWVLEVWVDPADLFRPCPDAAINDLKCELAFPDEASSEHKAWFAQQQAKAKANELLWSRLGYTYDWAQPDKPYGFSEYVVRQRAEMKLHQVGSLEVYGKE